MQDTGNAEWGRGTLPVQPITQTQLSRDLTVVATMINGNKKNLKTR